ncbi:MAG: exo-alpha-sialidase, partial [Clostridia bacterium]|nr:exo-alpha-sialidase [Clostridia bacterium]
RCKPLVTDSGRWIFFNYDQLTDTYGYSISDDEGKSFTRHYGVEKIPTSFDETMAYQKRSGRIRMLARNNRGYLAECTSRDGGMSWSEAKLSTIPSPDTRFYIGKTPSGRIILVNNAMSEERQNMSVWLSDDDGTTFPYRKTVDDPGYLLSYPDVDFYGDKIYLTYDRERTGAKEIRLLTFTEEDVISPDVQLHSKIVSKP